MRQGQVDDELHAQQRDLPRADPNVVLRQLGHNLGFVAMPQKQGLADIDQHVVAEGGAGRHQALQFLAAVGAVAARTSQRRFPGAEWPHVQCADPTDMCLSHLQSNAAVGAVRKRGTEGDRRRFAEQMRRCQPTRLAVESLGQRTDQTE